jgi:hypothetical protein
VRSVELDEEVMAFLAERARRTAEEFGKQEGESPLLEWGDVPEFRDLTADGKPRIFVEREGADWWRIRYQIAHEVFHWLCTPPQTFHWAHELFGVETAVRAMAAIGELDYARREIERLRGDAGSMSLDTMLVHELAVPYPPGLYGRAWVTGRELTSAVGWVRMKQLACCFDAAGKPDVLGWTQSLPTGEQAKVQAILGGPRAAPASS